MKHYVPLVLFPYMLLLDLFLFLRSGHVGTLPAAAGCAVVVLAVALNAAGLFLVARCLIRAGKDACTGTAGGRAGPELAGRVLACRFRDGGKPAGMQGRAAGRLYLHRAGRGYGEH